MGTNSDDERQEISGTKLHNVNLCDTRKLPENITILADFSSATNNILYTGFLCLPCNPLHVPVIL